MFVNLAIVRQGFAGVLTIRAQRRPRRRVRRRGRGRRSRRLGLWAQLHRIASAADDRTRRTSRIRRCRRKLVIISCDDLGACHAANVGVYGALRDGVATCASIMVPAPWARDAALRYQPTDDIGVHLTLNCEYDGYRCGPDHPRPLAAQWRGRLSRGTSTTCGSTPTPKRCCRECRAQIERALAWDIDVTHLAPHLSAITLRPEFFDVYLELAVEFRLPIRLPSTISADQAGFPFRQLADEEGVVFPDHFDHDWRAGSRDRVYEAIRQSCSRASPRSTCSRRSTRPRSGRSPTRPPAGSTTTRWSPTTRRSGRCSTPAARR